jgi:hypothetical protein
MFWNKPKKNGDAPVDGEMLEPVLEDPKEDATASSNGDVATAAPVVTVPCIGEVSAGSIEEAGGGSTIAAAESVALPVSGQNATVAKAKRSFLKKRAGSLEKRKVSAVPIRVLIGYLPEVTERDARDYALGVAEKHFEQPAIAHFDAFKYGEGYAYEVHEGGEGFAYLPSIIQHFNEQGPYQTGEKFEVVLRTGTRMVKVIRQRVGLQAVLLPESSQVEAGDWQPSKEKLQSALNQRTGFLVTGAGFFVAGFFALIVGSMLTRYQPYESAPPPTVTYVNFEDLPVAQWSKVQGLSSSEYVSKISYEHKHWMQPVIQTADTPPAPATGSAANTPATPPAPAQVGGASVPPQGLPAVSSPASSTPVVVPPLQKPASTPLAH